MRDMSNLLLTPKPGSKPRVASPELSTVLVSPWWRTRTQVPDLVNIFTEEDRPVVFKVASISPVRLIFIEATSTSTLSTCRIVFHQMHESTTAWRVSW